VAAIAVVGDDTREVRRDRTGMSRGLLKFSMRSLRIEIYSASANLEGIAARKSWQMLVCLQSTEALGLLSAWRQMISGKVCSEVLYLE
jgi:hypothetical protein